MTSAECTILFCLQDVIIGSVSFENSALVNTQITIKYKSYARKKLIQMQLPKLHELNNMECNIVNSVGTVE
jgi:hypothetical protein